MPKNFHTKQTQQNNEIVKTKLYQKLWKTCVFYQLLHGLTDLGLTNYVSKLAVDFCSNNHIYNIYSTIILENYLRPIHSQNTIGQVCFVGLHRKIVAQVS